MKKIVFLSILILGIILTLFLSGCQGDEIVKDNIEPNKVPHLKIFGQANVDMKVLDIIKSENSVNINAKIVEISNYTSLESKEILLEKGEDISLYFSGIGDTSTWKTNLLSNDLLINLNIRCLDGRTNSKDTFTKEDCFWNANDEDIKII